uniref:Uncharacterized protein n=1 Tax=Noccaea caerulescens TaxID=107243 RepID=A0A1J3IHD6_NOCCA
MVTTDSRRSNAVKEMEKHCKRKRRRKLLKLQVRAPVEEQQQAKELLKSDSFGLSFGAYYRLYVVLSLRMFEI